jgi:hypothetical protein
MHLRTILLLACAAPLGAWGPEGHHLVARIAETQLTAAARAQLAAILGPDATIVSVSTWADEVRRSRPETGNWHFIDIPIDKGHLDMERDCPKGDCVIAKIADLRKAVRDASLPAEQRREALRFLIHFIGDMHQPLHSSDHNDRGGNEVRVVFQGRQSNLHSVWDSALLARIGTEDQLFPELSREAARRRGKWSKGTVEKWAEEAHKSSRKVVYGKLPKPQGADRPLTLDAKYEQKADPLVREQLAKAGVRLAAVLNQAFQ